MKEDLQIIVVGAESPGATIARHLHNQGIAAVIAPPCQPEPIVIKNLHVPQVIERTRMPLTRNERRRIKRLGRI